MAHVITSATPHLIQRKDATGKWQSIAYRHNVPATDATLRQLMHDNPGVRYRAIPYTR